MLDCDCHPTLYDSQDNLQSPTVSQNFIRSFYYPIRCYTSFFNCRLSISLIILWTNLARSKRNNIMPKIAEFQSMQTDMTANYNICTHTGYICTLTMYLDGMGYFQIGAILIRNFCWPHVCIFSPSFTKWTWDDFSVVLSVFNCL